MNNPREEITKLVENSQRARRFLDDRVHSMALERASRINNEGPEAQLDYLLYWGEDEETVLEALKEELA